MQHWGFCKSSNQSFADKRIFDSLLKPRNAMWQEFPFPDPTVADEAEHGATQCNKKSSKYSNPLSKTPDKFLCCRTSAQAFAAANCIWKIPCISTSWVQFLYCSRTKQLKKSWQDHRMRSANATSVLRYGERNERRRTLLCCITFW